LIDFPDADCILIKNKIMARLAKGTHFRATIGNLIFYQWRGLPCVRTKGTVTRERVLESEEYASTRKHAGYFGQASKIASPIYRALPTDVRAPWAYRSITGDAASLLYKGMSEKQVTEMLRKKYIHDTGCNKKSITPRAFNPFPSTKEGKNKLKKLFLDLWTKQQKPLQQFKKAWENPRSYAPDTVKRIRDPYGFVEYFGKWRE
jgi:hypothetical protein